MNIIMFELDPITIDNKIFFLSSSYIRSWIKLEKLCQMVYTVANQQCLNLVYLYLYRSI